MKRLPVFLLFAASGLLAQPFQVRVQRDGNFFQAGTGTVVELPAPALGGAVSADFILVYTGATHAAIAKTELLGRSDFALSKTDTPTLAPAGTYTFTVRYTPSSSALAQALVVVTYQEDTGLPASLVLNVSGTAPEIAASYLLPSDNSYRALTAGGTIALPPVAIGSSVQSTVSLTNNGSGSGALNQIAITGAHWDLVNLPVLPGSISPGQTVSFGVRATPSDSSALAAKVQIAGPALSFSFNVSTSGYTAGLTYSLIPDSGAPASLLPGSAIPFPSTLLGGRSVAHVRIANPAPVATAVGTISLDPSTEFQLTGGGPASSLPADGSEDLTIAFAPTLAQTSSTVLRIGADTFPVSGTGLASTLAFRYTTPQGDVAMDALTVVTLPSAAVGETSTAQIIARNVSGQKVTLGKASVSDGLSAFRLVNAPALPLDLQPGQEASFGLQFAPPSTGTLTGSVAVDSNIFTVRGLATGPTHLPALRLQAPTGAGGALQQIAIAPVLDTPYGLDLTGTLTISIDSGSFAPDPAVQFSTGGRTANFRIPAGSLKAVFDSGANQVRIQTGSVAGDLQVAASLQTAAKLDVTPSGGAAIHFTVSPAAPTIFGVNLIKSSSGAFQVQVLGVATNRSLSTIKMQLTPGKYPLSQTQFTLDIQALADSWFRSTTSLDFGGQFSVSIPMAVTVPNPDPLNPPTLADVIKSISLTVSNALGTSDTANLTVQ